jgi:hypothetical protein
MSCCVTILKRIWYNNPAVTIAAMDVFGLAIRTSADAVLRPL